VLDRIRQRRSDVVPDEFVFVDSQGRPLSEEWLNKHVWKPTLRLADVREHTQRYIHDVYITLSLSADDDFSALSQPNSGPADGSWPQSTTALSLVIRLADGPKRP
jgi:hypothetical protein